MYSMPLSALPCFACVCSDLMHRHLRTILIGVKMKAIYGSKDGNRMKKVSSYRTKQQAAFLRCLAFVILPLLLLCGCMGEAPSRQGDSGKADPASAQAEVLEIREKMFMTQVNDIFMNLPAYVGKTIRYQGVYSSMHFEDSKNTYHFVARYVPGCCEGEYSMAGFEVIWEGDYPEENAWVEATGVLTQYGEDGTEYVHLALSSLKTLEERGEEYVRQ